MSVKHWCVSWSDCSWVVNYDKSCLKLSCNHRWIARWANHVAALDLFLVDASEVKANVVTCFCRFHLGVMSLNSLYLAYRPRWHDDHFVVCLHLARFNSSDRHSPYAGDRVYILNWNSQRLADRLFWWL